ncbi:unnamed protein product [Darwinula stevensoni]|uniref:Gustatory receptor n=1 Tax=Darwinula stevensoni TaxID=69355 RepID=A0A7R9ACM7_9CRUS|nr:unnamed protein product [Darwinula stevensoni]CAG0899968.1 unnamed protein product [Darwinula stevensoni]
MNSERKVISRREDVMAFLSENRVVLGILVLSGSLPLSGIISGISPKEEQPRFRLMSFPFGLALVLLGFRLAIFASPTELMIGIGDVFSSGSLQQSIVTLQIYTLQASIVFNVIYAGYRGRCLADLIRRFQADAPASLGRRRHLPLLAFLLAVVIYITSYALTLTNVSVSWALVRFNLEAPPFVVYDIVFFACCLHIGRCLEELIGQVLSAAPHSGLVKTRYLKIRADVRVACDIFGLPLAISLLQAFFLTFSEVYHVVSLLRSHLRNKAAGIFCSSFASFFYVLRFLLLINAAQHVLNRGEDLREEVLKLGSKEQREGMEDWDKPEECENREEWEKQEVCEKQDARKEWEALRDFIDANPLRFRLCRGLFLLDRSLLVSVLNSMVTYMVILVQFDKIPNE